MSDILPSIEPEQSGQVTKLDVPVSRYLSESFEAGQGESMYRAVSQTTEDQLDTGDSSKTLQPDEAQAKYGVGSLKFTQPVKESMANAMAERERNQMDHEMYLYSGATRGRLLPGMAASILGASANPLDLGSMFIPFVGEAGKVPAATRVGRALQRGLIPMETIEKTGIPAPRLVANMAQGAAWMGMADIPKMYEAHVENQPMPAIGADMVGQAAFAALLHGAGVGLRFISSKTHEVMAKQAMNDFLDDKSISAHTYIPLDEHVIQWQAMEHDRQLREQAANETNLAGIKRDIIKEKGEWPVDAAIKNTETGEVRTGPAHSLIPHDDWSEIPREDGFVTDKGRFVDRKEAAILAGVEDPEYNHLHLEGDKELMSESLDSMSDPDYLHPAERKTFDDIKEQYQMTDAEALNKIREIRQQKRENRILSNPDVQREIEVRRQAAIDRWVEDKKKQLKNPIDPEVNRAAEEPTIPRDQVERYAGDDAALDKSLDDDIEELGGITPAEAKLNKEKEVDELQKMLDEASADSNSDAPTDQNVLYRGVADSVDPKNHHGVMWFTDKDSASLYGEPMPYKVTTEHVAGDADLESVINMLGGEQKLIKELRKLNKDITGGGSDFYNLLYLPKVQKALRDGGFDSVRFDEPHDHIPGESYSTTVSLLPDTHVELLDKEPNSPNAIDAAVECLLKKIL